MISVEALSFAYDNKPVLNNINFTIEAQSTTALIGKSGCGKTTLLYILAGLLPYENGQVTISGKPVNALRKETGIILQDYGLFPFKTIESNLTLGLIARKIAPKAAKAIVFELAKSLAIESLLDKYPDQISGGQKQRVAIARSLAIKPDLLLMDEASSALDALTKEHIQQLMLDLYFQKITTLVFVTHSIEEAVFLGQNIWVMDSGNIIEKIKNPNFGNRDSMAFYDTCLQVRHALEGGLFNG